MPRVHAAGKEGQGHRVQSCDRDPEDRGLRQVRARKLQCIDCHVGIADIPTKTSCPRRSARPAIEKEAGAYANSIHGMSHALGASGAATCISCHGYHEIVPVRQLDSPVLQAQPAQTCAKCHSNKKLTEEYRI